MHIGKQVVKINEKNKKIKGNFKIFQNKISKFFAQDEAKTPKSNFI